MLKKQTFCSSDASNLDKSEELREKQTNLIVADKHGDEAEETHEEDDNKVAHNIESGQTYNVTRETVEELNNNSKEVLLTNSADVNKILNEDDREGDEEIEKNVDDNNIVGI